VSVVARTGLEADALSTAMLVSPRRFPGVVRSYVV
jgi:thiamine biosynthesis lipoprotein ApbE